MSRISRVGIGAAALGAALMTALAPGVAFATGGGDDDKGGHSKVDVDIRAECLLEEHGKWYAVYGYKNNGKSTVHVPVTDWRWDNDDDDDDDDDDDRRGKWTLNYLSPSKFNGDQTTKFQPGDHPAAFMVGPLTDHWKETTWYLGDDKASTKKGKTPMCQTGPQVPGDGNGLGSELVVLGSLPIAAGAVLVAHRRRQSRNTA